MTISYLIYLIECPSIDGLLDCFCFLAIMTSIAPNILIQAFVWTYAFIDSLEKTLMLGGIGGRRKRRRQRMRWLDGITNSMDVS